MRIHELRSYRDRINSRLLSGLGIFASFMVATALSLYVWSPARESSAFDWTTVDGASPYVASLSGNDEIRISATPSASQAVFDQDDTLELTSTCPYGAAIYLNMDSSESNALSRTGTDEGIKTISATTGTSLVDNSWGYSLDNGSTFLPMPLSNGAPVNIYNSEQVESNTEITVKYGMKIDSSIPSGYYSGNVLYSTVANPSCAKYTLSFDTDGGTEIDDIQLTYGQTVNLSDFVTTKENFTLKGWELVGTDISFMANETGVNPNPNEELNVILKAKFVNGFYAIDYMQDMTKAVCDATTTPDYSPSTLETEDDLLFDTDGSHFGDTNYVPQTTLIDRRDGTPYLVRKLHDGKCWMVGALKISNYVATPEDTDIIAGGTYSIPAASDLESFSNNGDGVFIDSNVGGYYGYEVATVGSVGRENGSVFRKYDYGRSDSSICPKGWRLPDAGIFDDYNHLSDYFYSTGFIRQALGLPLAGYVGSNSIEYAGEEGFFWTSVESYPRSTVYTLHFGDEWNYEMDGERSQKDGVLVNCVADEHYTIRLVANNDTDRVWIEKASKGNKAYFKKPFWEGHGFLGWFTEPDGGVEVPTDTTDWSSDMTLYAHWENVSKSIQGFNCSELTNTGDSINLIDERDNNVYTVVKLRDGKCWMADSLRIIDKDLDSLLSDISINSSFTIPESSSQGFTPTEDKVGALLGNDIGYYNWYAATAGSGLNVANSGKTLISICPKGWRLPNIVEFTNSQTGFYDLQDRTGFLLNGSASLSVRDADHDGWYWADSAKTSQYAYAMHLVNRGIEISSNYRNIRGANVRCIAEEHYFIDLDPQADDVTLSTSLYRVIPGQAVDIATPFRLGYEFLGWFTSPTGGVEITSDKTDWSSNIVLYAHWGHNSVGIHSIETMQEMTSSICSATTTPLASAKAFDTGGLHHGDTNYVPRTKLKDIRDNKYYTVSKLADGSCWMSQDLSLDLSPSKVLTNSDTDLNSKTTWTSGHTTQTELGIKWGESALAAGLAEHSYHPISSRAYHRAGKTQSSSPTLSGDQYLWESTGNYYSWAAATAGTGSGNQTYTDVQDSICPKGWRLPKGDTGQKSFTYLVNAYGLTKDVITQDPFNYIRAGYYKYDTGTVANDTYYTYIWSAYGFVNNGGVYAYNFSVQTELNPRAGYGRGDGRLVRCVAR